MPNQGNVHGFFWFYFINEHVLRYLDQRIPRDYDTVPLLLFWALTLLWLAPWCFYAIRPLRKLPWLRALRRKPLSREHQTELLLALWALLIVLFFSFSTRQEYYVLPALPAIALLAASWLVRVESTPEHLHSERRTAAVIATYSAAIALLMLVFYLLGPAPIPGHDVSEVLNSNPDDYALSLGHFMDLSLRAMGYFHPALIAAFLANLIGPTLHWWFLGRRQFFASRLSLAAGLAGFLIAAQLALIGFSPVLSSWNLIEKIQPLVHSHDEITINGEYESASTLGFYLKHQLRILNGRSSNLWYGSFFPDAPAIFDNTASFASRWNGQRRIFLWTEPEKLPTLPGPVYILVKNGGKEIVSNQP
jgi:hypothetical protein